MATAEYKTMTSAEIREDFLTFFESKGCKRYESSSLIPEDPSLLLANAGMNQFKEYYQGTKTMQEIGATSCQKCLRTNDIDNIGDARHLSFFEMLGNFSFGGYTKKDAITWAWEFITSDKHLGLPKDKLYITVFTNDDEAAQIWQDQGVEPDHISRLGEEDNFWAAGPTGPCGPCSEIYFDQGPEFEGEKPGDDGDRYLEFWNLVFTQYDRQEDGSMPELPHRNIDTGMGLERMAAIMQHKGSNYEGDVLDSLIHVGEKLCGKAYHSSRAVDTSLRILADHSRACTFMISDGILPSNEGRGYVLRRLLRRAIYHGRLQGIQGEFLSHYAEQVMKLMSVHYPQLEQNKALILGIITSEEEHFSATLDAGEALLEDALSSLATGEALSGELAFKLHDTYGFPIDLTREIALQKGHATDMDAFKRLMDAQKERARASQSRDAWANANTVWTKLSAQFEPTVFDGYDHNELVGARVLALVQGDEQISSASQGEEVEVVLDKTTFYGERGGQVGDTGTLESSCAGSTADAVSSSNDASTSASVCLEVCDTLHRPGELLSHICKVTRGSISVGDYLDCHINVHNRELIRRNHTATHLLDAALIKVLGDHVSQAGSLVAPDRLRFDFTHFEALTPQQISAVEDMVNAEIFAAEPMVTTIMSREEAKATGAIQLFEDMYGDTVRVVSTGSSSHPYSRELCGGTHARNTADIGCFKIISETSVGSNVRRLEALTSLACVAYMNACANELNTISQQLKCRPEDVSARIDMLKHERAEDARKLKQALMGASSDVISDCVSSAIQLDGYALALAKIEGVSPRDLREVWDSIRSRLGNSCACVLASSQDGKVGLLAAGTEAACENGFDAGALIKGAAPFVSGRGGGKKAMAQAGGSNPEGIQAALDFCRKRFTQE